VIDGLSVGDDTVGVIVGVRNGVGVIVGVADGIDVIVGVAGTCQGQGI
jgi:hypothetical protein